MEASSIIIESKFWVFLFLASARCICMVDGSKEFSSLYSERRFAALPVGAQIIVFLAFNFSALTKPTISVLFPEPGPPVIIEVAVDKD